MCKVLLITMNMIIVRQTVVRTQHSVSALQCRDKNKLRVVLHDDVNMRLVNLVWKKHMLLFPRATREEISGHLQYYVISSKVRPQLVSCPHNINVWEVIIFYWDYRKTPNILLRTLVWTVTASFLEELLLLQLHTHGIVDEGQMKSKSSTLKPR